MSPRPKKQKMKNNQGPVFVIFSCSGLLLPQKYSMMVCFLSFLFDYSNSNSFVLFLILRLSSSSSSSSSLLLVYNNYWHQKRSEYKNKRGTLRWFAFVGVCRGQVHWTPQKSDVQPSLTRVLEMRGTVTHLLSRITDQMTKKYRKPPPRDTQQ